MASSFYRISITIRFPNLEPGFHSFSVVKIYSLSLRPLRLCVKQFLSYPVPIFVPFVWFVANPHSLLCASAPSREIVF